MICNQITNKSKKIIADLRFNRFENKKDASLLLEASSCLNLLFFDCFQCWDEIVHSRLKTIL